MRAPAAPAAAAAAPPPGHGPDVLSPERGRPEM